MMSIDDPKQEEYFVSRLWEAGAFLMGRNTYEIMAGYWPSSDHPSARAMNEIPKVVLPVVTGKGAPLFPELDQAVKLRLVKSTAFPSGILELVYASADK
ncbi:dihydrofolate reductase family protein [Microbispora sp. GKU 823]|uniref:dihydrofolate reductase family protein n=1 Tax=Microbispora sp. GKU 823 TaxID=1652100 RepID=UPI001C4DFB25|nr:hypothetical protein [Microbispora sp. GKU 823]